MSYKDYLCLLNPSRDVAFGVKFQQLDGKSFNEMLEFLKQRIEDFFLEPIRVIMNSLISGKETNIGFVIISLCSTLIDVLSSYINPKELQIGKRFVDFLVKWMPGDFNKSFRNNRIIFYYDRKGKLIQAFSSSINYAQAFWFQFRCSVVHNASFGPYGGYDFGQSDLLEEYLFKDNMGRDRVELGVNPTLLFNNVKQIFNDYINKLRNPLEDVLRNNFKCKLLKDFGLKFT